jgi:hypothetical protein
MPNSNMSGSIPKELGEDMKQLMSLNLGGNKLEGAIPGTLAGLEQLTNLNLVLNRLTGVVPSLQFSQYTGNCALQAATGSTNHFACPLPPVSPRAPALYGLLLVASPTPPCSC